MKKSIHLPYVLGFLLLFIFFFLLAAVYREAGVKRLDQTVIDAVTAYQPHELTRAFIVITNSAARTNEFIVLAVFSAFSILWRRSWLEPVILGICLFVIRYGNAFLKGIYERKRPSLHRLVDIGGYSFPSGHAMISIGFFGLLFYLLVRQAKHSWVRHLLTVGGCVYIVLVGLSRVYLGVHYPSDVLAGFLAGGSLLLFFIVTYRLMISILKHERNS
ncbi:phosphatase PAP2 family protein [Fictibacillus sp. B-59209]|uniref:phosphatase PAP2 family protein n=1 Tax=Fictibacillus sp. B-59209 TaxID=3024873 RepID=UPI002E1C377C|nr:phosphatase PAP2 family protein [Fictibacillus sp. B-59209]